MLRNMDGKTISHYTILSKLGSGGMGEVYLAQDTKLDRTVALKILPAEFASHPERMRRFVQEAKAASALDHPNVAHIYEIGEADGTNFISMQYVEGETLDAKRKADQLTSNEITEIAVQIADALDAAGTKGIVHRDIKTGNIMITPRGQIKVLDFGLAKFESRIDRPEMSKMETGTSPGLIVGTVQFMSPEQALGKAVDHRSDIYSLGVVLYQLATGKLPFTGATQSETLNRILNEQPEAIARLNYSIDPELERIIRKCMEKDQERRYQSARELLIDLKNLKRDTESGTSTTRAKSARKAPAWLFPGLAALTALAIAAFLYFGGSRPHEVRSLAVLPFSGTESNPESEWLIDGITETTINSLSQIPDLKVMARSTVNRYKAQASDPLTTGRALKVDAVLTGTITRQSAGLNIAAELVNVEDGSLIWGNNYTSNLSNLGIVQRKISEQISNELRSRLTGEQKKEISMQFSENPEAYESYLKGRFFWNRRTPEGIIRAIDHFENAIRHDPEFALAYAGLADAYVVKSSPFLREIRYQKGKAAAEKALELEPTLAEAYVSLGATKEMEWDWREAEQFYRKAIQLKPNYPTAHQWLGEALTCLGQTEESILEARRALEFDPLSPVLLVSLSNNLYFAKRYDESAAAANKAIDLDPTAVYPRMRLIDIFVAKKQYAQAISKYEEVLKLDGRFEQEANAVGEVRAAFLKDGEKGFWKKKLEYDLAGLENSPPGPDGISGSRYEVARDYAMLGQTEPAIEWLKKSIELREQGLDEIKVDPRLQSLHSDPRFQELVAKLGLS